MNPETDFSIRSFIGGYDKNFTYLVTCFRTGTQIFIDASVNLSVIKPFIKIPPKAILITHTHGDHIAFLSQYLKEYPDLDDNIASWEVEDDYSFQKYETESDGYKAWHCEAGSADTAKRILVWSFYLNNAKSGTEFRHFRTTRAKMGRSVIFPATWTHFHKSEPNKGLKYLITGWIKYE